MEIIWEFVVENFEIIFGFGHSLKTIWILLGESAITFGTYLESIWKYFGHHLGIIWWWVVGGGGGDVSDHAVAGSGTRGLEATRVG